MPAARESKFTAIIDGYNNCECITLLRMNRNTLDFLIENFQVPVLGIGSCRRNRKYTKVTSKEHIYIYIYYMTRSISWRALAKTFEVFRTTARLCVHRVCLWLNSLKEEYLHWPKGSDDVRQTCKSIKEWDNMDGIIGVIGCNRIRIGRPSINSMNYMDDDQNFSLVLQAVVDGNCRFIDVYFGEPGGKSSMCVLKRSPLFAKILLSPDDIIPNSISMVGNVDYIPTEWLMSSFKDNFRSAEKERSYHCNNPTYPTAYLVELAFQSLKDRFWRLSNLEDPKNMIEKVDLVMSACILHNLCLSLGDEWWYGYELPHSDKFDTTSED